MGGFERFFPSGPSRRFLASRLLLGICFQAVCHGGPICTHSTGKYTVIGNSTFNPGSVFLLADECARSYNGSLFEIRNNTVADGIVSAMKAQGCRPESWAWGGWDGAFLYVAPTAAIDRLSMPVNQRLTEDEVQRFWRYSDGSSMRRSLFHDPQPDNWGGGLEACANIYIGSGAANDIPCIKADMHAMCVVDAPPQTKVCPILPPNPTSNTSTPATVTFPPNAPQHPPFPYGSVTYYTCPCGWVWKPLTRRIKPSATTAAVVTRVQAECYGTLGWTTYDVTECVAAADNVTTTRMQNGTARVVFESLSGNHSDAASACQQQGNNLPIIASASDFKNLVDLLNLWPCIQGSEIPIGRNIMLKLTPTMAENASAFKQTWLTVFPNSSWWHAGEPFHNSSSPGGCAVLLLKDGLWKLATKNCAATLASNSYICVNTSDPGNLGSCSKQVLETEKLGKVLFFSNDVQITSINVPFGTIATERCNCGRYYKDVYNASSIVTRSVCYGSLGWIPEKITECVQGFNSVQDSNYSYSLGESSTSYGITEAAKLCSATSQLRGSIAEARSASQVQMLAFLMQLHCRSHAFLAPTAWRDMPGSMLRVNQSLTRSQISSSWLLNEEAGLASDIPFIDGDPNNLLGVEQCLQIKADLSDGSSYGLLDVRCWDPSDKASHICAEPRGQNDISYCHFPTNPTQSHAISATMDLEQGGNTSNENNSNNYSSSPAESAFPFLATATYTCPDGYSWAPVTSWPTDSTANTVSATIRTQVTAKCLGTLGWTLYDVTRCVNATVCGPLPPTPSHVVQSCGVTASGTYECLQVCSGPPYAWVTGTSSHTVSCDPSTKLWSVSGDYCEAHCNASDVQNFPGVFRTWDGTHRLGSNSTYYCRGNDAFFANASLAATTYVTRCQANGRWSPLPANPLACLPYRCNSSLIPAFSGVLQTAGSQTTNSAVGAKVSYYCQDGYSFWGNTSAANRVLEITCEENGAWSFIPANVECRIYKCNPSSAPIAPAGAIKTHNWTISVVGASTYYSCPEGSAFDGNTSTRNLLLQSTCQSDGSWTPLAFNKPCKPLFCDASQITRFRGVSLTQSSDSIGSNATYSCPTYGTRLALAAKVNGTVVGSRSRTYSVTCLTDATWSRIPDDLVLVCSTSGYCDPMDLINDNFTSQYFGLQTNGTNQIGDVAYLLYMDYAEMWTCEAAGWREVRVPKWFPERIPVPTLPSYPVDFVETTLYHWGRAVENATCTGCLTGNISAPIESPGPTQFGQGVEIRGWDNECLEDNDFERRANFTCFANPMTCANGSNGISMGFFYKRGIPMKDVYLVYFNPKNSSANYPTKETLVSSGGDREGHPGIHVWWEGPFLGVLVSTGELYWEVLFLPKLFNDTWNNIGFRWFRPTPGVDDDGRLEVLINVEQQAATNQAKRASRVQSMLLPPTMLMGCHKDSTNTQKRFYGEGFFDEVAFWDTFIFDNTSRMFAGGYLPELNGVPTSVILDSIRESAKLEDERTRQVAWIAVQSIASDTNMTSEPVRPADAALNKTGETPSQQVENLVKFVTTLQSAEYISSSNSIGAVAKAARTSMSATSTLLCGNRHAWEEIADAGYKPGAYALVKSQNDYFMNMADSIAVDTKMTSAQMIDVTSDEIVSKLGVARIGHLRQSPTLKFPNYEDEIWGNGSMSKKFDYPVDTIEVPLGLYFPSSKTCDGTNLVNIEMNAYKNLDDFMPPNKVNPLKIVSQDNVIDSNILYFAFTLNKNIPKAKVAGCQPDALAMISNPIKLLFRHKMDEPAQEAGFKSRKLKFHTEEVEYNIKVRRCVWWNPSMNEFGGWDPSGCNIYDTADNFTMCECAAQGLFGILGEMIQHYELPTEPTWLTVVKFVGYGLSILCLPLFIVIVLKSKDHLHDQFHIMRANLAFALLVGLILHCVSDLHSIRDSRHACTAISVMFHYFYTAAGAWFCFESYASFVAITQGIIGGKLRAYIPLCWGLPFLSVGAALIQDMLSYGTDPRCMISFDNEMKWIFFGPLLTFASIGFLLSAIVICNISTPALRKDHIADELVSVGQGLAAQVTYFLCTWIAGVCAYFIYDWTIETPGFYALFQVLNAYTGVFYLVFMGFISLRFRMVVLGVAQKRKLMILQYLTRNQHEQLKPTPSVDNQQSDELPDELFAEGGPSSGRRKILTST